MRKLIVCMFVILMCSDANANIDNSNSDISYRQTVKLGRKSLNKKSIRMIIKEILDKKKNRYQYKAPPADMFFDRTIPIPTEDFLERFENLA